MMKRLESEILLSRAKMNAQEITEEENRDNFFLRVGRQLITLSAKVVGTALTRTKKRMRN